MRSCVAQRGDVDAARRQLRFELGEALRRLRLLGAQLVELPARLVAASRLQRQARCGSSASRVARPTTRVLGRLDGSAVAVSTARARRRQIGFALPQLAARRSSRRCAALGALALLPAAMALRHLHALSGRVGGLAVAGGRCGARARSRSCASMAMRWRRLSRSASSTAAASRATRQLFLAPRFARRPSRCGRAPDVPARATACSLLRAPARASSRPISAIVALQAAPLRAGDAQTRGRAAPPAARGTARPSSPALQVLDLAVDLAQDVVDAQQVLARALHLALGGELAAAIERRAGGLLDEQAAVLRLGVDQLLDAPLLDDRVGLRADPGAEEQLGDVLQPAGRLVDEVLRLAGAEVAAA